MNANLSAGALYREVLPITRSLLSEHGFTRDREGIYIRSIVPGFDFWLGLQRAHRGSALEIFPVVGLRSLDIERLVQELLDKPVFQPTLITSLRSVSPSPFKECIISSLIDMACIHDLVRGVEEHAMPIFSGLANLTAITECIAARRFIHNENAHVRLPIALFMLGRVEEAKSACRGFVRSLDGTLGPAAESYRRFSEKFFRLAAVPGEATNSPP